MLLLPIEAKADRLSLQMTNCVPLITCTGTPDETYCIETTTCLTAPVKWVPLCINTVDPSGCFRMLDTSASNCPARFYRAVCLPSPPACIPVSSCIAANFNGTPVAENNWIWFNSVVNIKGRNNGPATLLFDASTITFTVNGTDVTVSVPPAVIMFDASATSASTTFDTGAGTWMTIVPAGYNGNVFLSGVSYQLPFNLPGGVKNVDWCGDFSAGASGLTAQWQWAAAAYASPCALSPNDCNGLEVKPIDGPQQNPYNNGDHAGTPEYTGKSCVIGGARGGGGSNWTGSYSATVAVSLCPSN